MDNMFAVMVTAGGYTSCLLIEWKKRTRKVYQKMKSVLTCHKLHLIY